MVSPDPLVKTPMRKVTDDVFTVAPRISRSMAHSDTPEVILIFGWLAAGLPHLTKYVDSYAELYPSSTIILVRARGSTNWTSDTENKRLLGPAVELLKGTGHLQPGVRPPSTLVHIFSNGGGFKTLLFSELLAQGAKETIPAPKSLIVLDSLPGEGGLAHIVLTYTISLKNWLTKTIIAIPVAFAYAIIMGWIIVSRQPMPDTPRLYMFSSGDELVRIEDVERHVAESKRRGFQTSTEVFGKSSLHVAHVRTDPDRYWRSIKESWVSAPER
ncbi:hypothetical protein DL96DRAFT_1604977 [Flagelloscypha sp. PMI_526]|nr:hypothetical protein DL96DRAFT_1604977 [Flagelloscypha sp. PMI_526]